VLLRAPILHEGLTPMIKRALVFQHMDDEPPGLYGEFLEAEGAAIDVVMLHRGESIPALDDYDFLLVMGGAMDVWETDAHPWLNAEIMAIAEWTRDRKRPFFGVCLGLQLLAIALGGEVGKARAQEVGVCDVALTAHGRWHPMTRDLRRSMKVMQWHHAEVTRLPEGADVLASSPVTPVQIMSVGPNIMATQFHGELTPALVERWANIPQYVQWLEEANGAGAYGRVKADFAANAKAVRQMSRTLFNAVTAETRERAAA
jgi:GMP synthase-like glutamine amidotransferase